MSLSEVTRQSGWIVEGHIQRSWSAWDANHKYIWTHYEMAVNEVLHGARVTRVTVSEPGGSLDGVHQQFSGAIAYGLAEHDILFLYRTPIGYWRTVGGPQGKLVVNDSTREEWKARIRHLLSAPRAGAAIR